MDSSDVPMRTCRCRFLRDRAAPRLLPRRTWDRTEEERSYLLLTDARVDEVEAFLDLLANGWWRGNVVALRVKAGLIGGVVNGDELSLGTRVREGALLHDRLRSLFTFADGLDVAAFLGDDVVARFVTRGNSYRRRVK